jgi:cytochrome P450
VIDLSAVTVDDLERDPYPIYAELREHAPVAYMPCLDVWMVTSWATVEAACTDPVAFPAHVEHSPTDRALGGLSMMTTDGEPARRRRRPFDPTLRPRAVDATMTPIFEQLCRERLDAIERDGGSVDLVKAYFEPVSVLSLAHGVGIADAVDPATLVRWFGGLAAGVSNYEDDPAKTALCAAISAEIDEVVAPLFERQLDAPSSDLIGHLVGAVDGSLEDRLAFVMPSFKLVLLGGLQEPAHGGATVTERLLRHPDQLAAVRADPSLVPAAVEEGLRWTAPIGNLLGAWRPARRWPAWTSRWMHGRSWSSRRRTAIAPCGARRRMRSTSGARSGRACRSRSGRTTASGTPSRAPSSPRRSACSSSGSRGCGWIPPKHPCTEVTSTARPRRCAR